MKHQKWLICLFVVLFGCASEKEDNFSESENQTTAQSLSTPDLAGAPWPWCAPAIDASWGWECLVGKYFIRLYYHTGKFTNASCYKGTNLPKKVPHANIQLKKFKKVPANIAEAQLTHMDEGIARSVFNIHFGVYKSLDGKICYILWITSGYLKTCKKNPGGECICFNRCSLTLEELKDFVKEDLKEFSKKFSKIMGIQAVTGLVVFGAVEGLSLVAVDQAIKCFANPSGSICKFFLNFALQPAGEDNGDFGEPDDDSDDAPDEPDDEPDQPLLDDGPPPLNGCECNVSTNDENICFDDTIFGKPNPQEYKSELTVVGRDENFLYVFGKDTWLFDRVIFWSDPNTEGLENCESWGQWDGTFMVFKLQPCRTWFALTNESKTTWLSPDSQTTRVVEGVSVVPYGQGYNFTLTCGVEQNDFNLLKLKDYKNSECMYLSLDEALYSNKGVCFDDTITDEPLPSNIKPELTIVVRRGNYIHIFGANAESYYHAEFWADPNPNGLANFEINGEWNEFSMVFKLPPCRPWFALSNDEKTIWLSPNTDATRVEDGVSIVFDGKDYNFVLTCGAEPNNFNLLTENDFIQEQPQDDKEKNKTPIIECQLPDHLIVSIQANQVKLKGKDAKILQAANFWAWPNTSAPYDLVQWSYGIFDGCQIWYPIPEKQNSTNHWRFVLYEDDKFTNPVGPWYPATEIGKGIQAVYQGTDLVFEIQ